ncbi:mitochondrial ribosomal small subunit component [Pichia californica]|uniref:37S ribosomal protein S25, mitochondrial n=1 Tax=Pichia californica TaxID=460514 RepID=A0A9P7BEG0_9ASCO|nr:mitochondrial ribosomal small subunit component [[Candida] californica]KAG0689267.1 mitochondrial ribosomal small subunit component [[Candida] californica]
MNSIKTANQVLQRTSEYLSSGLVSSQPAWYKVLAYNTPKHYINKTVRLDVLEKIKSEEISTINNINEKLSDGFYATKVKVSKKQSISNLTKSQQLHFIEDELRLLFYKQHPWELADPKNLVENEYTLGNENFDWNHLRQFGKKLDGESVVQRTIFLMDNKNLTLLESYEQAKFEYYRLKIQDETEMNVVREEGEMFGAVYPKTIIEEGFDKETEVLQKWNSDAVEQTKILNAKYSNKDSSATSSSTDTSSIETETPLTEEDIFNKLKL